MTHPMLEHELSQLRAKYNDPYEMVQLPGITRGDVETIIGALLRQEMDFPVAVSFFSVLAQTLIAQSYSLKSTPYVFKFYPDEFGES